MTDRPSVDWIDALAPRATDAAQLAGDFRDVAETYSTRARRATARRRWDAWSRGYGVIGEIDGRLHVYAPDATTAEEATR